MNAAWGLGAPQTLDGDAAYAHARWSDGGRGVLETFEHSYETVPDGPEAAKDRRLTAAAIRLAGVWKLADVNESVAKLATADKTNSSLRHAAIDGLVTAKRS